MIKRLVSNKEIKKNSKVQLKKLIKLLEVKGVITSEEMNKLLGKD